MLELVAEYFDNIVIVGLRRQWEIPPTLTAGTTKVVDYRGKFSLLELMLVISKTRFFVGIDSFPAHVAQAFGVKSAILFGSVHPLALVWDQQRVWPIVAQLPCIGCYQTHLEPSSPFCMRRDEACMSALPDSIVRAQLSAMVSETPSDWSALTLRFHDLQAKFYRFLRYHPAPPERMFRRQSASNERIGNLIFEMTDKMAEMLSGHYQTAAIRSLRSHVSELEKQTAKQKGITVVD